MKHITDKIALEWAERQGLYGIPTMTLRCAISDARSIPELATAEQPPCGQDARDAALIGDLRRAIFDVKTVRRIEGDDMEVGSIQKLANVEKALGAAIAAQQRQGGG
jgi:hypothetical protein